MCCFLGKFAQLANILQDLRLQQISTLILSQTPVHSTDKQATLLHTLHILLHSPKHPVRLLHQTHHLHLQCPQITSLSTHIKAQVLQLLCSTSPESVAIELDWGTLQNIQLIFRNTKTSKDSSSFFNPAESVPKS